MRYAFALFFVSCLWGQQTSTTPDLTQSSSFSACSSTAGTTITVPDNTPVLFWRLTFYTDGVGFTAASVQIQGAPDNGGVPGVWTTTGFSTIDGANPIVSAAQGTVAIRGYFKFIRAQCVSATGSGGSIPFALLGYRGTNPAASAGGGAASNVNVSQYGGNSVISAGTNGAFATGGCVATAMAPTCNPVLIAGFDGTNQDDVRVDTSGQLVPSGVSTAMANGVSNTQILPQVGNAGTPTVAGERTFPLKFNGASWDRDQNCATAKPTITNLSGSGNTQIFAGTAAQNIYICDIEFSTGTPEDFKYTEGTGANCASGTADSTALMKNISAWSLTPGGGTTAYLITQTAGDSLCANQANAQAAAITVWAIKY